MEYLTSTQQPETTLPARKQAWQAPAIVLERSLTVSAQDGDPTGRRPARVRGGGFVAPLGLSPGQSGGCG